MMATDGRAAQGRSSSGRRHKKATDAAASSAAAENSHATRAGAFYARLAGLVDEWKRFESPLQHVDAIAFVTGDRIPKPEGGGGSGYGQKTQEEALATWATTEWLSCTACFVAPGHVFLVTASRSKAHFLRRLLDGHRTRFTPCGHAMPKLHYPVVAQDREATTAAVAHVLEVLCGENPVARLVRFTATPHIHIFPLPLQLPADMCTHTARTTGLRSPCTPVLSRHRQTVDVLQSGVENAFSTVVCGTLRARTRQHSGPATSTTITTTAATVVAQAACKRGWALSNVAKAAQIAGNVLSVRTWHNQRVCFVLLPTSTHFSPPLLLPPAAAAAPHTHASAAFTTPRRGLARHTDATECALGVDAGGAEPHASVAGGYVQHHGGGGARGDRGRCRKRLRVQAGGAKLPATEADRVLCSRQRAVSTIRWGGGYLPGPR